jgi:hypothetical protein
MVVFLAKNILADHLPECFPVILILNPALLCGSERQPVRWEHRGFMAGKMITAEVSEIIVFAQLLYYIFITKIFELLVF